MSFDPRPAAAALHHARQNGAPSGPLLEAIAPGDVAEGVAVQHALAALVGAVPPGGFKIGATTKRMQDYLGVTGPAAGFMRADALHASGAVLAWHEFRHVGVECEIGVRLARDLPAGPCDRDRASAAVGAVFAAIEIVENRYVNPAFGEGTRTGTPTLIADQFYHAAAVLGAPLPGDLADNPDLDLVELPGCILVDGTERGRGRGGDLLGHPMQALAWLAASDVAAAFGGLRAGQVVMLGSVTPPIWLDAAGLVTVRFDGFPEVTARFT